MLINLLVAYVSLILTQPNGTGDCGVAVNTPWPGKTVNDK
jgi:hypothetical protein